MSRSRKILEASVDGYADDFTPIDKFKYWRVIKNPQLGLSKWMVDHSGMLGLKANELMGLYKLFGHAHVGARLDITKILTMVGQISGIRPSPLDPLNALRLKGPKKVKDALFYIFQESGYFE